MKRALYAPSVLWLLGLLVACAQPEAANPPQAPRAGSPTSAAAPVKQDWEERWQSVIAEARKEGKVNFYTDWGTVAEPLVNRFSEKYGIEVERSSGTSTEQLAKLQAERRAGLYIADVFSKGSSSLLTTYKPEGFLAPIESSLILPEVRDTRYWTGGRLPYQDKDKTVFGMVLVTNRYVIYNKGLVKEGEITSYKDLLKPQYKEKVIVGDPSVAGAANALVTYLARNVWDLDDTSLYLRSLIKEQKAVVTRDPRLNVESVARGKHAIGLGPWPEPMVEFYRAGAPIGISTGLLEGTQVSCAAGTLALSNRPSHPNASIVFINWMLSKEGQEIFSRSYGNPSQRNDVAVSPEIPPFYIPQKGEKLYQSDEDFVLYQVEIRSIVKKIIDESLQ